MPNTKANPTLKIGLIFYYISASNNKVEVVKDVDWPFPQFFSFTDRIIWPFHVPDLKYFHVLCQKFSPL